MDLRAEFEEMISSQYKDSLREKGFTKDGRRLLWRPRSGYVELFQFHASQYNVPSMRCEYFLEAGVDFPTMGKCIRWAVARTHLTWPTLNGRAVWACRIDKRVVAEAPNSWIMESETDRGQMRAQIEAILEQASAVLSRHATVLKGELWFWRATAAVAGLLKAPDQTVS